METIRPTVIRPKKSVEIDEIATRLARASMSIVADYRGLSVAQISELRRQLRPVNVELRVTKNTLARIAANRVGRGELIPALEGPTAIAFSYGDPALLAKTLTDFIRMQRLQMPLRNALIGNRLLPGSEVNRIAELPSRDVLLAQVVGTVQGPISGLVNTLAATLGSLVGVLDQRRQQLEGPA